MIVVGSEAVLFPGETSPPPLTVATLTTLPASGATSTVIAIAGHEPSGASASERWQLIDALATSHAQLAPSALRATSPCGTMSLTVTTPVVGAAPVLLMTSEYAAPCCPCWKFPEWDLTIVRSGRPPIV